MKCEVCGKETHKLIPCHIGTKEAKVCSNECIIKLYDKVIEAQKSKEAHP